MYFTIEDKGHAKECTPASSLNRRLILIYRLIEKLFINLLESVHQVLDEEYKKLKSRRHRSSSYFCWSIIIKIITMWFEFEAIT